MDAVDQLISTLRGATFGERPSIKAQILALAKAEKGVSDREHLDILAESAPPAPPPVEEPEAIDDAEETEPTTDSESEPIDPNAPLTAADLDMVYDDPRGLMLHKSKVGDRWFATQVDPQTGQPQTFELHAQELEQIKEQLHGSPYWRLGN
jgi:hypothetical protein